jgi:hypothetical protein
LRGIRADRSGNGLLGAAVVAEIGAVRDVPLTIYADHGFTSTEQYFAFLLLLIRIGA